MIDPKSASYPILGAAQAAGVRYGLALELAWCVVHCRPLDDRRWNQAVEAIDLAHGFETSNKILRLLKAAHAEGRLYVGGVA